MNNPESIKIINRFFEALDMLIASRELRGAQTFTKKYGINTWNFKTVRKNPESDMFQLVWISYLVNDYGVSAEWLMTGKGGMFKSKDYVQPDDGGKRYKSVSEDELDHFNGKRCKITYRLRNRIYEATGDAKVEYDKHLYSKVVKIGDYIYKPEVLRSIKEVER
jgi:hypothetical protein